MDFVKINGDIPEFCIYEGNIQILFKDKLNYLKQVINLLEKDVISLDTFFEFSITYREILEKNNLVKIINPKYYFSYQLYEKLSDKEAKIYEDYFFGEIWNEGKKTALYQISQNQVVVVYGPTLWNHKNKITESNFKIFNREHQWLNTINFIKSLTEDTSVSEKLIYDIFNYECRMN